MKKSRKDNNHNAIVKAFYSLFIPFCDMHQVGGGFPDGMIWYQNKWELIEIKNLQWSYGKKGLNQNQRDWLADFPGATVYIVESVDDVLAIASGKLNTLKHVQG